MKCKKCRKKIPDGSKFCNFCGAKQGVQKMYRRPDGLYEKIIIIDGKRKAFRGKSEQEVTQKIAKYNKELEHGPLYSELVEAWEEEYCSKLSPSTVHGYQASKNESLDFFKGVYVKDIQTYDIQQFADSLSDSFSIHTISNYISTVSSIFSFGVRSRDFPIRYNPCRNVKITNGQPPTERRVATDDEVDIILSNTDKPFGLFPVFLLFTGCRRGEALALNWEDIDFKSDTIKINKSLSWQNCKPFIKEPKTRKSKRNIVLLPKLKELMKPRKKGLLFPVPENPVIISLQ